MYFRHGGTPCSPLLLTHSWASQDISKSPKGQKAPISAGSFKRGIRLSGLSLRFYSLHATGPRIWEAGPAAKTCWTQLFISTPWMWWRSQPTGWESWMMSTVWGRENNLGEMASATCSNKTRNLSLGAWLPSAVRWWAVVKSTGVWWPMGLRFQFWPNDLWPTTFLSEHWLSCEYNRDNSI